jgi:hypothetical protein
MPVYEVEVGGKVLEIEAADEASAAKAADDWHASQSAPQQPAAQPSLLERIFPKYGVGSALANGASFGTLPNIQAGAGALFEGGLNAVGLGSGMSMGDTYDHYLKRQQGARREFVEAAPLTNAALNAAGGLATGVGLAQNGLSITSRMADQGLSNLLPRMIAGAGEGAAMSAASGFGGAEGGFENRVGAARDNIMPGALFGAAFPAAKAIMDPVTDYGAGIYKALRDPTAHADDLMVRASQRAGLTPNEIADRVRAAQAQGVEGYTPTDAAGTNLTKLVKRAARTPSTFRDEALEAVGTRQQGQADRLRGYVGDALGNGRVAHQTEQQMVQGRSNAAQANYDIAYADPPPVGQVFDDALNRTSVQGALNRIVERVQGEQQMPISEVMTGNGTPTMRGWDLIKRELDHEVDRLYRSPNAGDRTLAGAVRDTRNQLREALGEHSPAYRDALAQFSDETTAINSIQAGRDVIRASNPDEALAGLGEILPQNMPLARMGAANELGNRIDAPSQAGADRTRALASPSMQRRLGALVQSPEAGETLAERLARETEMVRTNRQIAGGSDTAENLIEGTNAAVGSGGVMANLAVGNIGRAGGLALGRLGDVLGRAANGMTEPVANRIGQTAFSTDPGRFQALQRLFEEAQRRANAMPVAPTAANAAWAAMRQPGPQP